MVVITRHMQDAIGAINNEYQVGCNPYGMWLDECVTGSVHTTCQLAFDHKACHSASMLAAYNAYPKTGL